MRTRLRTLSVLAAQLIVFGQTARGSITGRVVDPASAVISFNAPLERINTGTGALYRAATSSVTTEATMLRTQNAELSTNGTTSRLNSFPISI